jgi:hypothetical protein
MGHLTKTKRRHGRVNLSELFLRLAERASQHKAPVPGGGGGLGGKGFLVAYVRVIRYVTPRPSYLWWPPNNAEQV